MKPLHASGRDSKRITVNLVQQPMVNWFNPAQLVPTALRALVSAVFGEYADNRELQAALDADASRKDERALDYSLHDELWFDYVSDLGDGWDSTYSIAWLLSRPELEVDGRRLPRGALLLMGGDQVYPTASRANYAQRCTGPYTAALPYCRLSPPDLLALPGNHDWYDGLGSFLRQFCQGRWVGGRKTRQQRSYFAARLPHGRWLWAIDIQLTTDIDDPQKQYFLQSAQRLQDGDQVVLCYPVSAWIATGDARNIPDVGPDAEGTHPNVAFLETLIQQRGAEVSLTLAGDLHFYAHYQLPGTDRHKLTAGGGGAFLHGTHDLPPELGLDEEGQHVSYRCAKAFPSTAHARVMRWYNLAFGWFNPAFCLFLGAIYLQCAWLWQSASKSVAVDMLDPRTGLMGLLSEKSLSWPNACEFALPALFHVLAHSPSTLLLTLMPIVGLLLFAQPGERRWASTKRFIWGGLHGVAHVALALLLFWGASLINRPFFAKPGLLNWMDQPVQVVLFALENLLCGYVFGGMLFGFYLLVSNMISRMHDEDLFSALHCADYKNFLRVHVSRTAVTVYPVKVERVCRAWKLGAAATKIHIKRSWLRRTWRFSVNEKDEQPWIEPAGGSIAAGLIEDPIVIPTRGKEGA